MNLISCRREVRSETERWLRIDQEILSEVAMKESMVLAGTRIVMLTRISGVKSTVFGTMYDETE